MELKNWKNTDLHYWVMVFIGLFIHRSQKEKNIKKYHKKLSVEDVCNYKKYVMEDICTRKYRLSNQKSSLEFLC